MPILDPGQLNTPIEIQRPATGQDALGQPIEGWDLVVKTWANVRHLNGTESIKAGAVTSSVNASIRIRWRKDIDASMRVLAGTTVYAIRAVLPDMQSRETVDLVCEVTQ